MTAATILHATMAETPVAAIVRAVVRVPAQATEIPVLQEVITDVVTRTSGQSVAAQLPHPILTEPSATLRRAAHQTMATPIPTVPTVAAVVVHRLLVAVPLVVAVAEEVRSVVVAVVV